MLRLFFLAVTTAFGFQVAEWTRWDRMDLGLWPTWPVNISAHLVVLSLWTWAWLWCWHGSTRLNNLLVSGIPYIAAIAAEAIQYKMKGHVPDIIGLVLNLVAAGGASLAYRRILRQGGKDVERPKADGAKSKVESRNWES